MTFLVRFFEILMLDRFSQREKMRNFLKKLQLFQDEPFTEFAIDITLKS